MNREVLEHRLRQSFEGDPAEFRAVVRSAVDLSDSGKHRTDTGHALSPADVTGHLQDAPDGTVADRWNWWMGALEFAYGGYLDYQVRAWEE